MGLVDYSDSESEPEVQPKAPARETKPSNSKTFQKFVDRSNPGKILVNLPAASSSVAENPAPSDEPPAKRARTAGGSRFSAFSSFLPPPKTAAKPAASPAQISSSSGKTVSRPGVHLKTGAEPAFSREQPSNEDYREDGSTGGTGGGGGGGGLKLPPPKNHNTGSASGPSIPTDQIPAEEVKLVGKPLMFKPLSVSRKPAKKKTFKPSETSGSAAPKAPAAPAPSNAVPSAITEQPKKKISLFSIGAETDSPQTHAEASTSTGAYEPLFSAAEEGPADDDDTAPSAYEGDYPAPTSSSHTQPQSLSSIADDMHLSAQARRELFGREGVAPGTGKVVNFDMSREYEANEVIRQSGEAASHNPVRSIRAGKHSLRQLVNAVQSNASALEESFAAGKGKRNEAGARYGWR